MVVGRDAVLDVFGIAVGVGDSNDGDVKFSGFFNGDVFAVGVNDEHYAGKNAHFSYTAKSVSEAIQQKFFESSPIMGVKGKI